MAMGGRRGLVAASVAFGATLAVPGLEASGALPLAEPPREIAFVLDGPLAPTLPWLLPFRDASVERHGPMRLYQSGRWGRWLTVPWSSYEWEPLLRPEDDESAAHDGHDAASVGSVRLAAPDGQGGDGGATFGLGPIPLALPEAARERWWVDALLEPRSRPLAPTFDTSGPNLAGDGFGLLYWLPPSKPVVDWRCRRRPVTIARYGAESDSFELMRCDGTIPPGAQDRLSLLARPPEVPRPVDLLPDEPDEAAWAARREWLPNVRLVHPRLIWALQKLADAFPRRTVYLVSGYRPGALVGGGTVDDPGSGHRNHRSLHADGRALDLFVHGARNEDVLEVCRKLKDVGCGFYPNSSFVHLDVRRAHSGSALWIDASAPGEPSRYVDSWPGVVESGAMGWVAPQHRTPGP